MLFIIIMVLICSVGFMYLLRIISAIIGGIIGIFAQPSGKVKGPKLTKAERKELRDSYPLLASIDVADYIVSQEEEWYDLDTLDPEIAALVMENLHNRADVSKVVTDGNKISVVLVEGDLPQLEETECQTN